MWSGPRNLSTAMMYSWRSRADTTVWDEPMYGHYLVVTGIDHPGRAETIAACLTDPADVVDEMLHGVSATPLRFYKNMAHHLVGFDVAIVDEMENYLLTRDPRDMLPSLAAGLGRAPVMRDTGFADQIAIVDRIEASGRHPIVLDSREILRDPASVLEQLCDALDVPWDPAMLSWPTGPKPEDGVWAPYWYDRLHATTGFEPYRPKDVPLAPELAAIYAECAPLYQRLSEYSLRA
jgi:hypothetical protein